MYNVAESFNITLILTSKLMFTTIIISINLNKKQEKTYISTQTCIFLIH